jgi:hypothetical protein
MPPVDRRSPIRNKPTDPGYSLMEFMREFPDDETCVTWLWRARFAEDGETAYCEPCNKPRPHKRYATSDMATSRPTV